MKSIMHCGLSIEGALRNPKNWVNNIIVDGKCLRTVKEVKRFFEEELAMGHEMLPLSGECEGFDYVTGCPGHTREENKNERTE
jgi:hypothetical protein